MKNLHLVNFSEVFHEIRVRNVEHLYIEDRIDYYYKMGVHANILD